MTSRLALVKLLLWGATWLLVACANGNKKQNASLSSQDFSGNPSLSVWGFSCEIGGNNCRDRALGRKMRKLAQKEFAALNYFSTGSQEPTDRNHLRDVSDMVWTSGETSLLKDMESLVDTDYMAYGRVFEFDKSARVLRVELILVHRESQKKLSKVGEGPGGSLEAAVADAVRRIGEELR